MNLGQHNSIINQPKKMDKYFWSSYTIKYSIAMKLNYISQLNLNYSVVTNAPPVPYKSTTLMPHHRFASVLFSSLCILKINRVRWVLITVHQTYHGRNHKDVPLIFITSLHISLSKTNPVTTSDINMTQLQLTLEQHRG